jgi:hypothetical protein
MKPIKIVQFTNADMEAHVFGEYVSVCWNMRQTKKKIRQVGMTFSATVWERVGEPFIDFPYIREGDDGEVWKDEDDLISGGISAATAKKVSTELRLAAEYLESGKWETV